jgi:SOS-response transcriptional repressor LexA
MQAAFSDIRNCRFRRFAVDECMTRDEIREWADGERGRRKLLAEALGITADKVTKSITPAGERSFTDREMAIVERVIGQSTGRPYNGVSVLPLLGSVPAGNWKEAIRDARGTVTVPDPSVPPSAYALEPEGDSMDLVVMEGGRIVIDPDDRELFAGRYYVIQNAEGETTFKQYKEGPPRLVPCSSNPAHQEIPMGEAFKVLGRVIGSYSRM